MKLFGIFSKMVDNGTMLRTIEANPERKAKSKFFAISSIVYSILTAITGVLSVFLLTANSADSMLKIVSIIVGSVLIFTAIGLFVKAITSLLYQFRINKSPITYVALSVFILSMVALVIGTILFIVL